jgi:hypothetical protein
VAGVRVRTNSFLAANCDRRSSDAVPIDDTPLHSWAMPDDVDLGNLLRIDQVFDQESGDPYVPATTHAGLESLRTYRLTEWTEGGRSRVSVEIMNRAPARKRTKVQIDYTTTLGPGANGLDPGTISSPFTGSDVLPGLVTVTNLVGTVGGRLARTSKLQEEELRLALRSRGRAVIADDFIRMTRAFDPDRIHDVKLSRGIARGPRGLRSSVVVAGQVTPASFVNELERDAFCAQLTSFLQDRCTIGETVEVRLEEVGG